MPPARRHPLIVVKSSPLHGRGVFARTLLRKGRRILEYAGDRIRWEDAQDEPDGIVCLFSVGRSLVIDGRSHGNEARFVNHSCEPNCEAVLENGCVFLHALRTIRKGDELTYDYALELGRRPTRRDRARHPCSCGAPACRGTLLDLSRCRRSRSSA